MKNLSKKILLLAVVVMTGSMLMTAMTAVWSPATQVAYAQDAPTEEEEPESCDKDGGGGSMAWLICGVLGIMDAMVSWLDDQINGLLEVPPGYFANAGLQNTWRRMRNIAYIVLVPITLVMVISTALGFEFFSAYTIKRALPRIIAAAIFIALSYQLCTFFVTLINEVSQGILGILTSSVGGADTSLRALFDPDNTESWGLSVSLLFGAIGGGVAVAALGSIGVVVSVIAMAILALLLAFIALAARQLLLVALILIAPLAILAWIFPGNDKLWKLWWESFSKLLLLYPLIMLLIGSGRALAFVIQGTTTGTLETFLKLIAYIGPFFFIPTMFKFAGTLFGTLSSVGRDSTRGIFDRSRKRRAAKIAENREKWHAGDRYGSEGLGARLVNRSGAGLGVGWKGRFGMGGRGAEARATMAHVNAAKAAKEDPRLTTFGQTNDDGAAVMQLSGGSTAGGRRATARLRASRHWLDQETETRHGQLVAGHVANGMTQAAATAQADLDINTVDERMRVQAMLDERADRAFNSAAAIGFTASNALAMHSIVPQNKARAIGAGDWETVEFGLNQLTANNPALREQAEQTFQYHAYSNGRTDLGRRTVAGGTGRAQPSQVVTGYGAGIEAAGADVTARYQAALAAGDYEAAANVGSEVAAYRGAMGQASPDNRRTLNEHMFEALGVDINDNRSVEQQLAHQVAANQVGPAVWATLTDAQRDAAAAPHVARMHALAGLWEGQTPPTSDTRLKRNIQAVTRLPMGITLYRYQYIWSDQVYVGVMAQELLETHPEAVYVGPDGFYRVSYETLGLRLLTLEEWETLSSYAALY